MSPYHFAYVYTCVGDANRALDWLERAVVDRAGLACSIKGSFVFASLRAHPRFHALLMRMIDRRGATFYTSCAAANISRCIGLVQQTTGSRTNNNVKVGRLEPKREQTVLAGWHKQAGK